MGVTGKKTQPAPAEGAERTEPIVPHVEQAGGGAPWLGEERPRRSSILEDERVRRGAWTVAGILGFWFAIQVLWPVPIGTIVEGVVLGGLTALIALGIALIYKANRIVNFAGAEIGTPAAMLSVLLITSLQAPFFVALAVALIGGPLVGLIVHTAFIRWFSKAPRLILTVVTIAVAPLVGGGALAIPLAFDRTIPPQDYPSPFDWTFSIGTTIFRGNHIIAMIAIPLMIGVLIFFFRYTNVGIAVRASASSADRAYLLGIPVKRMETIVWMLAGGLATLSIFLRAGIIGLPTGEGRLLGPSILLPALAAVVIGRMERFPTIVLTALATGVIHLAVFRSTGEAQFVAPVLFVVILLGLLTQRDVKSRLAAAMTSTWQAVYEPRAVPRELRGVPEVVWGRRLGALALLGFLFTAPLWMSGGDTIRVAGIMIFAILGISLVVLTGWAGEISLGQVAFLGIGAAVAGALTQRVGAREGLIGTVFGDLAVALLVAGLAGALVAVLIGLPALRVRGLFLAVSTLALALATSDYFLNQRFFGDFLPGGLVERPPILLHVSTATDQRMYYLILASLLAMIFAAKGIRRSRTGRALVSLRENERAAEAFGINAIRVKLTAFAVSGFMAAYAGGLFIHLVRSLGVAPFRAIESLQAFIMVVIGGVGSIAGGIIGAVYYMGLLRWFLPRILPAEIQFIGFLLGSGLGVFLLLLVAKGGIAEIMYRVRDSILRRIARRRGIHVPSLVADARIVEEEMAEEEAMYTAAPATEAAVPAGPPPPENGQTVAKARRGEQSGRRR